MKDGLKHMRLNFYIEGSEPGRKGTVHSESVEVGYQYLRVLIPHVTAVAKCTEVVVRLLLVKCSHTATKL